MVSGSTRRGRLGSLRTLLLLAAMGSLTLALPLGGAGRSAGPPALAPRGAAETPAVAPTPARSVTAAAATLSVAGATPRAVELSWTEQDDLDFENYTLELSTSGSNGPWTVAFVETDDADTTYLDDALTPGASYNWRVLTYALLTAGAASNVLNETQPTLPYLGFTTPSSTSASFDWTNNASYGGDIGFTSYGLYESENGMPASLAATFSSVGDLTDELSGLASGASYAFYVNTTDCLGGCGTGSAVPSVTESNVITFGTIRPLTVSISWDHDVVDAGQSDYFSCTPSGGQAPYTFGWAFATANYTPGLSSESHAFAAPGSPFISCLVTDAASDEASANTSILVDAPPTVAIDLNRTTADVGEPTAFGCASSNGTSPVEVGWTFGNGATSNAPNTTYTYASNGTYVATCTAEDYTGTIASSSQIVNISKDPTSVLSDSSDAAAPRTVLTFSDALALGRAPFSDPVWGFGDGNGSSGSPAYHAYDAPGSYTVWARAVDANGIAVNATETVVISPVLLTVGSLPSQLTEGTNYTFSASASGGAGGPYAYSWTFGTGSPVTNASLVRHFKVTGTMHVELAVTDRLGEPAYHNFTLTVVAAPVPATSTASAVAGSGLWILVPALLVGVLVGVLALGFFRRREERPSSGAAQYVLPTDPERTLKGVAVCRNCGTPNNAARESCSSCGADLRTPIFG
jgi:hypothetical protein